LENSLTDLNLREKATLLPLALIALALGIMPSLVFDKINDSVLALGCLYSKRITFNNSK
jgi:NADH-quinone oxidoreductase subunit M